MDTTVQNKIVSFIWSVADDCLRDIYVRGKYRDVILPMTVLRRFDVVLEPTKKEVLEMKKTLEENKVENKDPALCAVSKQAFYNTSPFVLKDFRSREKSQQLRNDFEAYIEGYSKNVQDILEKFRFNEQIDTMCSNGILGSVIEKFVSPSINLSPYPVKSPDGKTELPALDNHAMGTVFEELIRKFNEENNEEAGEHFTPRDVIELMADLVLMPVQDKLVDGTYNCYDGACGTGGMLTIAEKRLLEIAEKNKKKLSIHLYGQEISPETYAITKADMLIKGLGENAKNIKPFSTLSDDGFPTEHFNFMLSNPPYGKSWKVDLDRMGGKDGITDSRFVVNYASDTKDEMTQLAMIPRSSDGQLLFLLNNVAKMKTPEENNGLGSRIAEVHNGSALFTGDAGSGESNARRYLIENDYVEAIIALPENMFYNTGIGTYIWLLSNTKEKKRRGYVQLIDAANIKSPLRKNMGNKNCEFTPELREQIMKIYQEFSPDQNGECSKVFDGREFGYWKITVCRPLRLNYSTAEEHIEKMQDGLALLIKDRKEYTGYLKCLRAIDQTKVFKDTKTFEKELNEAVRNNGSASASAKVTKYVLKSLSEKDPAAEIVTDKKGTPVADTELNDTENVPLLYEGGIKAFFEKEVKPFAADAWIDEKKTVIGYEISFTRYFYKPVRLRTLAEISADFRKLEKDTEGLRDRIFGL